MGNASRTTYTVNYQTRSGLEQNRSKLGELEAGRFAAQVIMAGASHVSISQVAP